LNASVAIAMGATVSYLVGAIPFGLLIGLTRGIDIRQAGSGNIGATNVFRCVGKGWGVLALVCDALKGFLPAFFLPRSLAAGAGVDPSVFGLVCGCLAIAGHNWPIYLRFRGGKGIATSAGALLGIAPQALGIGFVAWAVLFALTRYVSVASIAAAVAIVAAGWTLYPVRAPSLPWALTVLGLVAVWKHRGNIQRLRAGTENRIVFGRNRNRAAGSPAGGQAGTNRS
jgi:glycerol-3-phosphate acyltransferase PlsY